MLVERVDRVPKVTKWRAERLEVMRGKVRSGMKMVPRSVWGGEVVDEVESDCAEEEDNDQGEP
jgi:hypothetical protein